MFNVFCYFLSKNERKKCIEKYVAIENINKNTPGYAFLTEGVHFYRKE